MAEVFNLQLSNGLQYPYQIVFSKRAKHIRIKLSQQGDLSVTLPTSTKVKHAHAFVLSKSIWIEKNLAKVKCPEEKKLPTNLDLKLLDESWDILYSETEGSNHVSPSIKEKEGFIIEIQGSQIQLKDQETVKKILNHWCKKKAKNIFNPMLQKISELHGFHYHRLSIRAQKTRWGSCSHKKNINLNCKLLFMPEEVVSYVMIHELCHTIEMNHSNRFWALVEDCDSQYRLHKKTLSALGKSIPL